MFEKKSIDIKKIFKTLPMVLAKRAFGFFLVLLLFSLIAGGFLFYKYSILAEKTTPQALEQPVQFKQDIYQEVLDEWQNQEKRFIQAETKIYPNPF